MNKDPESSVSYATADDPVLKRLVISLIESLSGKHFIEERYRVAINRLKAGEPFWDAALSELEISTSISSSEHLEDYPKEGPLVVVANHPFGLIDGLIASKITSELRENFVVLTNSVLCTHPLLDRYLLPIDFAGTREANRANVKARHKALEVLKDGGAVVIFPGGGVATRKFLGPHSELPWGPFTAKMIQQTDASIMGLYFEGSNSELFHVASWVSYTLRLALFVHETRRMMGSTVNVQVRPPLHSDKFQSEKDKEQIMASLLKHTISF